MKIKLVFYALVVAVSNVNFSSAKTDLQTLHRLNIDSSVQDNDGKYFDQIALDSFASPSKNEFPDDFPNYPQTSYTATEEFRKSLKKPHKLNEKVQYVTAEPYRESFSQDYVHHALKTHSEKSNKEKTSIGPTQSSSAASSMIEEHSIQTRDDSRKAFPSKRKKAETLPEIFEDYRNVFHESKRLYAKPSPVTKFGSFSTTSSTSSSTTTTPAPFVDEFEKFYRPHSSDAIIKKETVKNGGDELVNNYHYYYPDKTVDDFHFPSSTFAPSVVSTTTNYPTTPTATSWLKKKPKLKSFQKKKIAPVKYDFSSTDPYQFQPVIPRPSEYATFEHFYPSLDLPSSTVDTVSTITSHKIFKPTKKFNKSNNSNNFYLPTSTFSPAPAFATTKKPTRKIPSSTLVPFRNVKPSFNASPTHRPSSTVAHFSTTKAPDFFKYSTPTTTAAPTMKSYESFHVHPSSSTQLTSSLSFDESRDDVVVIKPKSPFINGDSSSSSSPEQPKYEVKERIIYRFVPEYVNMTGSGHENNFDSFYKTFNQTSINDEEFLKNFHKNYNYEPFTEKDAGPLPIDDNMNFDNTDGKQRAEKKAMIVQISQDDNEQDDPYPSPSPSPYPLQYPSAYPSPPPYSSQYPPELRDRDYPPARYDEDDHQAEASKNQYLFLYSLDNEEKKRPKHQKLKKVKPQQQPEQSVFYHHHQHDYKEPKFEDSDTDSEFDSEFDSELMNTENVRIVDPNVRGGKPLEFTKDDYLRHIKQAVKQYMKENHKDSYETLKAKSQDSKSPKAATQALQNLSPQQFKHFAQQMKLPKNVFSAGQLQDAIEDMRESPQVDLTTKRPKAKPMDLAALDVGQSYQHVSHFDHAAALKNVEEFDQTNAVPKAKIHLTSQSYKDINNLRKPQYDDEDEEPSPNLFKGYKLPAIKPYSHLQQDQQGQKTYATMIDGKKLPRLRGNPNDDDDEDDNKLDDPIDAPIQIINGIPVANPYNIDLSTLKYMLGGMAQAQVNDQIKDLDGSSTNNNFKFPNNWKFSPNQFANFNSQQQQQSSSIYPVFGSQGQSQYDNRRQKKTQKKNVVSDHDYPLLSQLTAYNNNFNGNNGKKKAKSPQRNPGLVDYSSWNSNKKQRAEQQFSASNQNKIYLRPVLKNKHSRDEPMLTQVRLPRIHQVAPSTEMRPPPPAAVKSQSKGHIVLKKVV